MRLLILADADSAHTEKWANSLREAGIQIEVFSLTAPRFTRYKNDIHLNISALPRETTANKETSFKKTAYLRTLPQIRRLIRRFKPDIVHAFYASSYGLLGALSGFHPFVISVWGSDIMSFPQLSPLNTAIVKFNLFRSDYVQATSAFLAGETQAYTTKAVTVVPFGVDTGRFSPASNRDSECFTIGCVKNFEPQYGHKVLIEAVAQLHATRPALPIRLILAGTGSMEAEYRNFIAFRGISELTEFHGYVRQEELPVLLHSFDVAVYPSFRESFGVSVIEAGSCGIPVIVSDIPGFREVYIEGRTGLNFSAGDSDMLAGQLRKLADDYHFRAKIGSEAARFVHEKFDIRKCIELQVSLYGKLLTSNRK